MKHKKLLISLMIIITTILFSLTIYLIKNLNNNSVLNQISSEVKRAQSYNEITDEDSNIDNCEYVKFNSFFIRDLDGDGYAEKYDGTCNYIDKMATLYFEINVLTDGKLENGVISINGQNFDLSTALVRDEVIKKDYIGTNTKQIELNTINYGTQKLFSGNVKANIGNNINKYSREDNTITLTGTWVSTDGSKSININKTITLKTDWYGKTETDVIDTLRDHSIEETIGEKDITLDFSVGYKETAEELLIQKQITEIEIPDLNGYAPIEVTVSTQNCNYTYDENTQKLLIEKEATINDNGDIVSSIARKNIYDIRVKYPIEAYENSSSETISITFPTTGYYYGYNNSSDEFSEENPYISKISKSYTHTWKQITEETTNITKFNVYIGNRSYNPDTNSYNYLVSKELPLNIYNNLGQTENISDKYVVQWSGYLGRDIPSQNGISMQEAGEDKFLDTKGNYSSLLQYIKTTGIYFSNVDGFLSDDGYIKVYDNNTNELLMTFTKENWNKYTYSSPYSFDKTVKSIKIETSKANENSYFNAFQIKEIDDEKLTNDFTLENFRNLDYIYSYLNGGVLLDNSKTEIGNEENRAIYEEPVSLAKFTVTPTTITNQETKNIVMDITTQTTNYNEKTWKNGEFVIELPEEILGVVINDVTSDNYNVQITSYENYSENGKEYIKIYTQNNEPTTFNLKINADITGDPRKPNISSSIKLYAINEACQNYRSTSSTKDILDINGNKNFEENVLYKECPVQIVAPLSLLTAQTLSNFDDLGTEAVSPQVAMIDKSGVKQDATINVSITNNYTGSVSETIIVGKIPFEGNTYQINGRELASTFSLKMKPGGLVVPEAVANIAKIYYSTNEVVTEDLKDESNNWKRAEEVENWENIKTYAIDLSEYVLNRKETLTFSYGVEVPENTNYNNVSYSTHAVYFCLDTEDGKLKTSTEVNRLGIMIAKKFDVSLTKYKVGTNTKVGGATYKITDGIFTRTGITDSNGNVTISGLYVDKEYTLKEIKVTDNYMLNEDEVKFKLLIDEQGNPQINIISGNLRDNATLTNIDNKLILNLSVEDISKYDLKITKTDSNTLERLKGVKFKLTGGVYSTSGRIFTTNSNGEISIVNLIPGEKYTFQEIKANGYFVDPSIVTFSVSRNSNNKLEITTDNANFANAIIIEEEGIDKASVNVSLTNQAIPTYSLNINKTNDKSEALPGSQFKITSIDTGDVQYFTTDIDGKITITGLYEFIENKSITGEYIIQEVAATEGYITDTTEVRFKTERKDGILEVSILEGEDAALSTSSDMESITLNFVNKPIFNLTKTGDNNELLPNTVFKITDLEGNFVKDINGNIIGEFVENKEDANDGYYALTTDENGHITANLPKGLYKFVEMEAPEGYELPKNEDERTYYVGIGESRAAETEINVKWAKSVSGNGFSNIYDIETTEDGGFVVVGSFQGECDLNNDKVTDITSKGNLDSLIAKYDENGNLEWYTSYGEEGADEFYSVSLSLDGGYVVSGYEYTDNHEDGVVIKLDSSGNQIWKNSISGELKEEVRDVNILDTGDIVAVGRFFSPYIDLSENVRIENKGNYNGFIVCYEQDGSYKWSNSLTGNTNINVTSVTDNSKGIIVSANFLNNINISGNEITSNGEQDAILIFYTLTGAYKGHHVIGGVGVESIEKVITDLDENIIAVGAYSDNITIGKDNLVSSSSTKFTNGLVVKYTPEGEYISNYNFGGTEKNDSKITSVETTEDGGIVLGGWFYSNVDIDRDGILEYTTKDTTSNGIIIKLNSNKEIEWSKNITGSSYNSVYGVTELYNGGIIAVGNFDSSVLQVEQLKSSSSPEMIENASEFLDKQGYNDSFIINLDEIVLEAGIPEVQEISVKNELKEFKITSEIAQNSEEKRVGGTITGINTKDENIKLVENIKYGYDSNQEIIITPEENYSIYKVKVNGEEIKILPDENGVAKIPVFKEVKENYHIEVTFEKGLSSVIVHHYLKDREGNYTEVKLSEDEYLTGKVGDLYSTSPKIDIKGYELEKSDENNYVIPINSVGKFEETQIVVNYYYEELPLSLIVHHYLEGTENSLIADEVYEIFKGEEYKTTPNSKLLETYDLIENLTTVKPETAEIQGVLNEDTIVTFYYKLKEYGITTSVKPIKVNMVNEDTNEVEEITVKGGTISGENEKTYEKVIHGNNSVKPIIITPEEGFRVKNITINGNEIEFVENSDKTVTLDNFTNVTENKEIIVEFEIIEGTITVHHYIEETTNKVPLADGNLAEDELKTGYVGKPYATKPKDNILDGYELSRIPDNSSGKYTEGNIEITYYYKKRTDLSYTVNYLEKDTNKILSEAKVVANQTFGDTVTENAIDIDGYNKLDPVSKSIEIQVENSIINFYYTKRTDLSYTVNYLEEGTTNAIKPAKTVTGQTYGTEVQASSHIEEITGYEYVNSSAESIIIGTEENVLNLYYKKGTFEYKVEYYYDGKIDNSKTETLTAVYQDVIEEYKDKNITGYKLEKTENLPLTVSEDSKNNVVKVYYIIDDAQTKELSYTVEYYKNGTKVDEDTQTETQIVQVLKPDTLDVNKAEIKLTDKYVGYKLGEIKVNEEKVNNLPDTVTSGDVIKVYYVVDETQTKELSYTVEYYKDGEKQDKDSKVVTKTVQVLEADILEVNKSDINVINQYVGYKLEKTEPEPIPDTVSNGEVIKVYYVKDKFNYTVEYYYDGKIDNSKTETLTATYQDVIEEYKDKNITGYKVEKTENLPLTISEVSENNVIKVYYVKDKFNYTVEYYYDDKIDESKTEKLTATYQDVIENYKDKNITGYKLEKTESLPLTISEVSENNVIKVYYVKDKFNYTVEYYYDGKIDNSKTEILTATYQDVIEEYKDKNITGYKLEKTENLPLTISEDSKNNVVKVYYIIDSAQTKELSYTVEYYKNGTKVDEDTQTETQIVQVLKPDTLDVNKAEIKLTDKYVGYKLGELKVNDTQVENLPETVTSGDVIKVYYVIDESQTKELSYTVEYYKDGKKQDKDTQTETKTVQVLESDILEVDKSDINVINQYVGYKLEKTEPEQIPDTVSNGEVIKVYYVKDKFNYTVEYYYDGKIDENKTETLTATYQDVIENYKDKNITGYKLEKTENLPLTISEVSENNVIKVYYIIDDGNTKTLSYTVEYYKDGEKQDKDSKVVTKTVQVLEPDTLEVNKEQIDISNKYDGYVLEGIYVNNEKVNDIPDVLNDTDIIAIKYIKRTDLSYTVNYLEEGTTNAIKPAKTVTGQTYGAEIQASVHKEEITGYEYVSSSAESIIIGTKETVLNLYYKKATYEYKVEYYYDETLDSELTYTNTSKFEDVITEYPEQEKEGYKFEKVEGLPLTISADSRNNVVKVYYIIDSAQTKELSYTVEYYKNGTKVDEDTQTETQIVQVLKPDTLDVNKAEIKLTDKYVGYKLGELKVNDTQVENLPETVTSGTVIKVYYVVDESQTKELSYTVEYYKNETKIDKDTQTETKPVQVLEPDTIEVIKENINLVNKYDGYVLKEIRLNEKVIKEVPAEVNDGDKIIVIYTERTDLSYTVNYLEKDTNKILSEAKVVNSQRFGDTVIENAINIEGYNKVEPVSKSIEIQVDNNEINFYYTKRTDLSYTVNYLEEGTTNAIKPAKTVTGQTYETEIKASVHKEEITGYEYVNSSAESIIIGTKENVLSLYYKKGTYEYKVEYYYNGIKDSELTYTNTSKFEDVITEYPEQEKEGYKFDKVEGLPLTISEDSKNNVVKVYYVTDDSKTKELSYTVEYYKDGEKIEKDTQIVRKTVQLLAPDTVEVDKEQIDISNKYDGYELEGIYVNDKKVNTIPDVLNDKDVIAVKYIKRTDLSYTVNYLEKDTNKVLSQAKVVNNQTFGDTVTENAIDIDGYNKVDSVSKSIKIQVDNNEINFYYTKVTDLSYTVNYLEEGTDKALKDPIIVEGQTYGTEIQASSHIEEITGYEYVNSNAESIIIGTEENVLNLYYKKATYEYMVEYYYDGMIDEDKTERKTALYQQEITTYEDKNINGYKLEKTENLPLVISEYAALNVIKVYYTKNEFGYTVEYYYDGVKDESKTENKTALYEEEIISYPDKNTEGYKLEKVENLPLTISKNAEENIIKVYYIRKDAQIVVKYVDKVSGEEISDEVIKTGKVFDKYNLTDAEKEIEGYTVIEKPNPLEGEFTEENQEKIFYYAKNAKVIVKYLEKDETPEDITDNKEVAKEIVIEGYEGKEYKTEKKEIAEYTFVEVTENAVGTMTEEPIIVVYYYVANAKVVVNHIDKNTGEKLETVIYEGLEGEEYTSTSRYFENYILVEKPEKETVEMTKGTIVLNYYYVHVSGGVIEKHINKNTNEILYNEIHEGNEGDEYKTEAKEFEGYEIIKDEEGKAIYPENAEGIMTQEVIEVVYYYERKASVKVMYVDKITGEKIGEEDYIYGHEGESYKTEAKKIEGYSIEKDLEGNLMYPENKEGIMTVRVNEDGTVETEIEVTYYYKHNAKVEEKHINVITGKTIEKETYIGQEGDKYKTTSKEIEGYDLVEEKMPENAEGEMTREVIEVNYYYVRKMQVVVEYIDKNTGEKIKELEEIDSDLNDNNDNNLDDSSDDNLNNNDNLDNNKEETKTYAEKDSTEYIYGHEGDSYKTEQKEFEKYKFVEVTGNPEGIMTVNLDEDGKEITTMYVRYYYAYESAGVVEKHIDIVTGKEIEKERKYEGNEGDAYKTERKAIEGYDIVEEKIPENAEGKMTKELIEVKYYYIRKVKVTVEYVDKETGKKLREDIIIEGHENERYVTESKEFEGYKLEVEPKNKEGKLEKENITVRYYYTKINSGNNNDNGNNNTDNNNNNNNGNSNNNSNNNGNNNNSNNNNGNNSNSGTNVNSSNSSSNNSSNSNKNNTVLTPSTGDRVPVIALTIIGLVIIANILQYKISHRKKSKH